MRILTVTRAGRRIFRYLARDLKARGHTVAKFNFNAGDLVFSCASARSTIPTARMPGANGCANICENWKPDAILLFGDQRPIHRIAMQIARENEIAVYAFEEGYIRPNYVTFERGGNNANSPLLRNGNRLHPRPRAASRRNSSVPQFGVDGPARHALLHRQGHRHLAFPGLSAPPPPRPSSAKPICGPARMCGCCRIARCDNELIEELTSEEQAPPFFLVALQVHDDLQLLRHGNGWRNRTLIKAAIASFAEHAAKDDILVFKVHPDGSRPSPLPCSRIQGSPQNAASSIA